MKIRFLTLWVTLMVVFFWNGLPANIQAANQPEQLKPNVQHMKVITKGMDGIHIQDSWYQPETTNYRLDEIVYSFVAGIEEQIDLRRTIYTDKGKEKYYMSSIKGKKRENISISKEDYNVFSPYNSLFDSVSSTYKTKDWVSLGKVYYNGKELNKVKRVIIMPKGSEVRIAYLEPSTGLPVKEDWFGNDDNAPFVTNIYFFDEIIDPTGSVFIIPSEEEQ